jgi:peptidoglycan/xylan/chitin deacetylase (PgdA/CDA1 family)
LRVTPEVDRLWGLEADDRLHVACGSRDAQVRVDHAPEELLALVGTAEICVPGLGQIDGEPLIAGTSSTGERVVLAARADDEVRLAFDPDPAIRALASRALLTPQAPLTSRLPVSYRVAPAWLRRRGRDIAVARRRRTLSAGFPAWPVEPSIEALRAIHRLARTALGGQPRAPWPEGRRFAIVLTHDVDDPSNLTTAHALAADEAQHRLRSAWYVVGADRPPDRAGLQSLLDAGHELGLHDAHHDNRGAFLPAGELATRLETCRELIDALQMRGYRSPSLLRTKALYGALRDRFAYDSSIPDTSLLPRRNGCATVLPFQVDGVLVLPLTLPSDGQLLSLGLDADAIANAWIEKAQWVRSAGGVAMVLTHPEPGFAQEPAVREAYRRFLAWAATQADAWHALPRELAAHWSSRPAMRLATT